MVIYLGFERQKTEILTQWYKLGREKLWSRITPLDMRMTLGVRVKLTYPERASGY